MEYEIHRKETRGSADHGWLKVNHSFSFAEYYNPERMGFGLLRVFNDDIIEAETGFGKHPHRDMEIITIPLTGELSHEDSTGGKGVIHHGEIQVMSAGTGVVHSEFNHHKEFSTNVLQTWIYPREKNLKPRYDQKNFSKQGRKNTFQLVVSPDGMRDSLWINQDAYYSLADLDKNKELSYELNKSGNGAYLFVISGSITINDEKLNSRDAIAMKSFNDFKIKANEDSEIILIEVPLA